MRITETLQITWRDFVQWDVIQNKTSVTIGDYNITFYDEDEKYDFIVSICSTNDNETFLEIMFNHEGDEIKLRVVKCEEDDGQYNNDKYQTFFIYSWMSVISCPPWDSLFRINTEYDFVSRVLGFVITEVAKQKKEAYEKWMEPVILDTRQLSDTSQIVVRRYNNNIERIELDIIIPEEIKEMIEDPKRKELKDMPGIFQSLCPDIDLTSLNGFQIRSKKCNETEKELICISFTSFEFK